LLGVVLPVATLSYWLIEKPGRSLLRSALSVRRPDRPSSAGL
jgi:peptidoglycan/LPS O-acetylase OafA/YrhL